MNVPKNAGLTPAGRVRLVHRLLSGESRRSGAEQPRLSVRTVGKWWDRWLAGDRELADRSSRPRRMPQRLKRVVRRQIGKLRRLRKSSRSIAHELRVPLSTVVTEQRRQGLARLPSLQPPTPVVRYQRERPGELLHLDTKKLARIGHIGHRIHGDRARRKQGIGWEVVYAVVDDATRLAYSEVLTDETAVTAGAFLTRAIAWYAALGVRVEAVMTDNGRNFTARVFRAALRAAGLPHRRTRPYTPRTNGKVERFIQTLLREWAYVRPYPRSWVRTRAVRPYLRYSNLERPHTALGYRPRSRGWQQ